MSVLNQSGEEQVECPLCMEPLEVDDLNFFPCTCGYQICRFCWHRIRTDENGLCPACRKAYPENPADFKPLSQEEVARLKQEKRHKDQQRKQKITENRKHLGNVRVVQRNLVFVVGLPTRLADPEVLKKHEYFGKFGKIHKVVINQSTSYAGSQGPSASAYVTYNKSEDALRAIQAVNNIVVDGRTIKTSLGTTKYCSNFMKNLPCPKPDCMYLHDLGDSEASFTKEEMQQGKHQDYEKKLHEQLLNSYNKERKPTPSPPAVSIPSTLCQNVVTTCSTANIIVNSNICQSNNSKEAWPSLQPGTTVSSSSSASSIATNSSSNSSSSSKSENCSQKKQKSDQKSGKKRGKDKSHASHSEEHKNDFGKSSTQAQHGEKNSLSQVSSRNSNSMSSDLTEGESSDCQDGETESGVNTSTRNRLFVANGCVSNLFEPDNNSFFSSNSFTKAPTTTSSNTAVEWPPNGLTVTHIPDVLPPVHSSEDWQAAFGFANTDSKSEEEVLQSSHLQSSNLTNSLPINRHNKLESVDAQHIGLKFFNGPVSHSMSLDSVMPTKLEQHSIADFPGHLNTNGSIFGSSGSNTGFVQDPSTFIPNHQQHSFIPGTLQHIGTHHLIPNGLPISQANKYITDLHLQQIHNSHQMPPGMDGTIFSSNLITNGSKFRNDFIMQNENISSVTGGINLDCKLSNRDSIGMGLIENSSALDSDTRLHSIRQNNISEPIANGYISYNGDIDNSNLIRYKAVPSKDDRITDDLGFDPFHETQKALAEMIEKENQSVNQHNHSLINNHHHSHLGQQYNHINHLSSNYSPASSFGDSKLSNVYSQQNQLQSHILSQQNHRLPQNVSVSGCTKMLDGISLGHSSAPPLSPSSSRTRLPPPGFTTTPNHMNSFGLGIPRGPTNSGSKILPFMGINSTATTTTATSNSNNPPSPIQNSAPSQTQNSMFQPSNHSYVGVSKQLGDYSSKDFSENIRSLLCSTNVSCSSPPRASVQNSFGVPPPPLPSLSQKGWNGAVPCSDWTSLDPAIVSSSLPANYLPPVSVPLNHTRWLRSPSDESSVLFYNSEWSASNPPPGFSVPQQNSTGIPEMAKIENL